MEQMNQEATNEQTSPARLRELAKINPTLASLVASNPNAEAELLSELADSEEDFIRKNVAANPNTPMEVLWKLGEVFPASVLGNAVFPLLLLENPNLLEEIPQETLMSFLKCPTVPISFMEWAAKNDLGKLRLCLAMNCQTPRIILEELVRSKNRELTETAELHVNYVGELEEDWQEAFRRNMARSTIFYSARYNDKNAYAPYFLGILVAIGLVGELFWELLARLEKINIRKVAAKSDRLPLNLLEELGRDPSEKVRCAVARNLGAPLELLARLVKDKVWNVRCGVAENLNASPQLLEQLATDEQKQVRVAVAKNPNAPTYLLKELANDEGLFVRVASNPSTPKTLLENLARAKLECSPDLRIVLATNPKTPVDILEKLKDDKEPVVRDRLAGNPSTPKYLLEIFARSKRDWTREALASNPKIPKNIIHLLAEDKYSRVRKALAANPTTLPVVLEPLCRDRAPVVRKALATNPKAPISILEEGLSGLLTDRKVDAKTLLRYLREKPEGLPALLELIVDRSSVLIRTIALWHPQMPSKVLAENGRSLRWPERCAIAGNPNTPIETLQLLATDGNRIVRAAAKENLQRALNT